MATIKEIAKLSGVSPMTVSNVINKKHHKVSEKTIKKVEQIIAELDYVPNMSARSLVSKNSNIVVLIIPQTLENDPDIEYPMHNPFYGEFINSIELNLRKNGYYMMLRFVAEDEEYHSLLKLWNADAIIVLGTDQKQFDMNLAKLNIPLVMVDSYIQSQRPLSTIVSDDRKGGRLAAERLLASGCSNLAVVSSEYSGDSVSSERLDGFLGGLEALDYKMDTGNIHSGYPSYKNELSIADSIISNKNDGVFAFSDMLALGIIEGLTLKGVKVPEEVSVIGFDGIFVGEISRPKLTTVKQDISEKGQKAVEVILKTIKDKSVIEHIVLPVNLIEKETVR